MTANPDVEVTDVEVETDTVSFRVDQVGVPVLVKVSYFPNWTVDGAEGPYRVTPNFMVVVPTENEVTLSFGRSSVEWVGLLATLLGLALVGWLMSRTIVGTSRRPSSVPGRVHPDPRSRAGSTGRRSTRRLPSAGRGRRRRLDTSPEPR